MSHRAQRPFRAIPRQLTPLAFRLISGVEIKQPLNRLRGLALVRRDPSVSFHPALRPILQVLALSDHESPVLVPGGWNRNDLDERALQDMVETYNPDAQPGPIKQGHDDKGPGLGFVKALRLGEFTPPGAKKAVKALFAKYEVTPQLRAAVSAGWRMRSIEAWPPKHPNNPTPGKWHFKGFALLGAESPACPNLTPLHLSDQDTEAEAPVLLLADASPSDNPGAAPAPSDKGTAMELTPEQEVALKEAADLKKKNQELETKLSDQLRQAEQREVKLSLDDLVKDKKIVPAQAKALEPILLSLDSQEATVELSDNTKATPRAALLKVLSGLKAHGLSASAGLPADAPVELADKQKSKKKALDAKVAEYKSKGMTAAAALAQATREVEASDDME